MPQQQQSTSMPAFNWLGLLAGGRGYASQYFSLKDRVAAEEAMRQQRFAEQGQAAQSLLSSPQYQEFLKKPFDRNTAFQLWAQSQGGPAADVGNTLLGQTTGAIYGREGTLFADELQRRQQEAQNAFSRSQLLYGHELQMQSQNAAQAFQKSQTLLQADLGKQATTFQTEESLRADQIKRERDIQAQQSIFQSLPAQAALNYQYDQIYGPGNRGQNDVVKVGDQLALRPSLGSTEGQKIMSLGQAQSGIVDVLERMGTMLDDPRQMNVQEWNALATYAGPKIKDMLTLGTYDEGTRQLIADLIPSMPPSAMRGRPDLLGYTREKLRRGQLFLKQDMQNLSDRSLYPIDAFRKNRLYDPKNLPPPPPVDKVFTDTGKKIEDLRRNNPPAAAPSFDPYSRAPVAAAPRGQSFGPAIPPEITEKLMRSFDPYARP